MIISCIAAMSENYVIGRGNTLPWHLSADLKRFKSITVGHTLIMGRKTYDSIGRPLPKRTSIVITRNDRYDAPGAVVVHSLDEALGRCYDQDEVFIIGGAAIYRLALPRTQRLYLTLVHTEIEGNVYFPNDALDDFRLVAGEWQRYVDLNTSEKFLLCKREKAQDEVAVSWRVYERNMMLNEC